jgi:hypothetical protein
MKKVLIIGITIVAVIALGNVLLVSAQGGQPPFGQNGTCLVSGYTCPFSGTASYGAGGMMGGRVPGGMMGSGMMNGRGMMGSGTYTGTMPMHGAMMGMHNSMLGAHGMHEQVWTAVAKKLGMTYAELNTAMQNGQTVAQLSQAKGISVDELKAAALNAMQASFADLVRQGVMTQAQADWILDHMDDMPMFNFDQGFGPVPGGMMRGRVPGGMLQNRQPPTGPQG